MSADYPPGPAGTGPTRPDFSKGSPSGVTSGSGRGGKPLEVTWNDLQDPSVLAQAQRMHEAQNQPPIRQVGPPPPLAPTVWWRGNLASLTLAGLAGGLVAAVVDEILLQPDSVTHWYGTSSKTANVLFTLIVALVIGCVIAAWDGIMTKDRSKIGQQLKVAAPLLLVIGLVGGFIMDAIYEPMSRHVQETAYARYEYLSSGYFDYVRGHLHLPRAIGFGIAGLCCGVALGASSRSGRRALHGALGGFVGGFVGGFLFDFIGSSSGTPARFVAIGLTGTAIGAAIGAVEHVAREHWLEIVSGGMAGKQFILYTTETTVGSSPAAQITLVRDPYIAPFHAGLARRGDGLAIRSLDPNAPVLVNQVPVIDQVLADGQVIQLGSTMLRYRAKTATNMPTGPILG